MSNSDLFNSILQNISDRVSNDVKSNFTTQLQELKKDLLAKDANDELMTRDEACKFLQIDPSTLWSWQNRGKVTAYGISGNRRYYKRSELIEALTPIKK